MAAPDPQDWLRASIRYQRLADADILRLLRQSTQDIEAQILKIISTGKGSVGATVRQYQLQQIRQTMLREQAKLFRKVKDIAQARRLEAAAAAIQLNNRAMADLFASAGRSDLATMVGEALNVGLATTLDVAITRMTESKVSLAQKIYNNNAWMDGRVENGINSALARGLSAREFAKEAVSWFSPNTPGGMRYAAMRLARTEINNAFHAMSIAAADQPWVKGMQWHLSRSHPKPDECDEIARNDPDDLGAGCYKVKNVPKKPHPQCFCFVTPLPEDEDEFLDNLVSGKYDSHIDGIRAASGAQKFAPVKAIKSPPVKATKAPVKAVKAVPEKKSPVKKAAKSAAEKKAPVKRAKKLTPEQQAFQRALDERESLRIAKERDKGLAPKERSATLDWRYPDTSANRVQTHARMKDIYGRRLRMPPVSGFSDTLGESLDQMGRLPNRVHNKLLGHFEAFDEDSGIYLNRGASTEVGSPHFSRLKGVHPRGWPEGSTWDDVDAGCSPQLHSKQIAIGDSMGRGKHSEAVHEMFHMVDDTADGGQGFLSWSQTDPWKNNTDAILQDLTPSPYFTKFGNPTGYYSELFAEFGNGWSETQAIGNQDLRLKIIAAKYLGVPERQLHGETWERSKGAMQKLFDVIERAAK